MSEIWCIKAGINWPPPAPNDMASPEQVVDALEFVMRLYPDWLFEHLGSGTISIYRWDATTHRYMTWLAYRHT